MDWFSPPLIFECGQVFHWRRTESGYIGQSGGHLLELCETPQGWECPDAPYWSAYFDAALDYDALMDRQRNARLRAAMERYRGLRVLRQPPWEALLAFLLSSNNHIPRIKSLVFRLCECFGADLGRGVFAFPEPALLARQEEGLLRELGCGYRAKYIIGTARRIADGFPLDDLARRPYAEAKKTLKELPGVGDKVADCVLLFGLHHAEAFPVDVWIERCLPRYGITGNREEMAEKARKRFGKQAGILQQFMFHDIRNEGE